MDKTQFKKIVNRMPLIMLWRSFFLIIILVVVLNFLWLTPNLNSIKDRIFTHQVEMAEKIKSDLNFLLTKSVNDIAIELTISPFVERALSGNLDKVSQDEVLNFLSNKRFVNEIVLIDKNGNEILQSFNGVVVKGDGLKNISDKIFFQQAIQNGSYVGFVHNIEGLKHNMIALRKVSFNNSNFEGVVYVSINIKDALMGYAKEANDYNNERMYLFDIYGFIIDHYDSSKIGESLARIDLIKKAFWYNRESKNVINSMTYREHDYTFPVVYFNDSGEKIQATIKSIGELGLAVVIEESYAKAWMAWQNILMLFIFGISIFTIVSIFLVRYGIRIVRLSDNIEWEKRQTEAIVSNLISGVIQYDINFRILLINPMAEIILGITREDIFGKKADINFLKESDKYDSLMMILYPESFDDIVKIPTENGKPVVFEVKITKPRELELQVTTIPTYDRSGIISGYVKVLRDISREKAISRTKSEFISIAAHQLRTPLSAIKWIFKMLIDGDVGAISSEQKEFLQKGYYSNERIIQLVGDMLNVARIEEGRFGYEFSYFDISELIKKNIAEYELKAEEKKIKISFIKTRDNINPIKIDYARIGLVLQNLLDNALKYTQNGGSISIELVRLNDSFIRVSIKDTGVGVPKDQRDRLFSKFFRGSNVIKMQTDGTGLGLFIAKNIINRHGGEIWVDVEDGKGTTFFFTLPVDESLIPAKEESVHDTISI
ncbi:MAG: ATP-binding protein [Patescibacteria group bacterium]